MRAITIVHAIWSAFLIEVEACDDCQGSDVIQTRLVRRAQPGALEALSGPNRPLEWGQINFLHTTDTHGWLSGHVKEPNYGADWGDFLSFAGTMKKKAADLGVDLLVVDTGVSLKIDYESTTVLIM
jgi:2',3'-cyclic-nucleotide 2'-phosphodiesterase (5'-nucleotidase family)